MSTGIGAGTLPSEPRPKGKQGGVCSRRWGAQAWHRTCLSEGAVGPQDRQRQRAASAAAYRATRSSSASPGLDTPHPSLPPTGQITSLPACSSTVPQSIARVLPTPREAGTSTSAPELRAPTRTSLGRRHGGTREHLGAYPSVKITALHEVPHHVVGAGIVLEDFVHLDNTGVLQAPQDAHLPKREAGRRGGRYGVVERG